MLRQKNSKGVYMRVKRLLLILLISLLTVFTLSAYQLSPLNVTYDSRGADSAKVYTIVNDSDSPIALQLVSQKRNVDLDGNEYTEEAPEYFSIQPNKMIIRPNSTQLVRVQYRGPSTLPKELAFRIVSEQIPYSLGAQEAQSGQMISFLFVYSTSAYVKPERVIESTETSAEINEEGKLEILITNTGTVHQLLNDLSVTVKGDNGGEYTLTDDDMGVIKGQNLLTDSTLRIVLDVPEALSGATAFDVAISYNYRYSS